MYCFVPNIIFMELNWKSKVVCSNCFLYYVILYQLESYVDKHKSNYCSEDWSFPSVLLYQYIIET